MRLNPMIVFRKESDGSGILFNPENGETFGLNATSVILWECFADGKNEAEALTVLASRVVKLPESARDDVDSFANRLREKGFLLA